MRSAILNSAMRPVVIVLHDPARDRGSRFLHVAILRDPHFLFLQAAMIATRASPTDFMKKSTSWTGLSGFWRGTTSI